MTDRIAPERTCVPPVLVSRETIAGVIVSVYESPTSLTAVTEYRGQREEWMLVTSERAELRNCCAAARGMAKHGRGDRDGLAVYKSVGGAQ